MKAKALSKKDILDGMKIREMYEKISEEAKIQSGAYLSALFDKEMYQKESESKHQKDKEVV